MNALYVTMSLPLLLVLAGFNHAHGLTTFGKSSNAQNVPQQPVGKQCTFHTNCSIIKGTTCIKNYCYCGDNSHPVNGGCSKSQKGPRHLCTTAEECVIGADCLPLKDVTKNPESGGNEDYKFCQCTEGYVETANFCSGGDTLRLPTGIFSLAVCTIVLSVYQKI